METNLEKLTEILCKVEEIKEQIMELKFGTVLETKTGIKRIFVEFELLRNNIYNLNKFFGKGIKGDIKLINKSQYTIIGNPIQDHMLRMYCEKLIFQGDYIFYTNLDLTNKTGLDNTKPLHKQSEECLGRIVEFLETNK